jgi:hypothetical protein
LGDDWFFSSRSAPDGKKYLRDTLTQAGYSPKKIDLVLGKDIDIDNASSYETWFERVKDLVDSKK